MTIAPVGHTSLSKKEAQALGVEAYAYLYPLVTMEVTRRQAVNVPAGERPGFGPMGAFSHFRAYPTADFRAVVRPNFDTLYSSAWLDLTEGPVVISVPDTAGRYYLLPMLDMWTDVFAVPGKRTTGTESGEFAVVPPGWSGELPPGVHRVQATTFYVWIIGRTQTNGASDYDNVHAIQDALRITPLAGGAGEPAGFAPDPSVDMTTPTVGQVNSMAAREFFELAAELMKLHPPHVTDWSVLSRIQALGLEPGKSFDYDALPADARAGLDAAPAETLGLMQASIPHLAPPLNGWQMLTDTMGVYGNAYLRRAIVTLVGLGANQPEDAVYPLNIADVDGNPLDGSNDYVLHFDHDELPPVDAFWSVTMYDGEGFQSANELDRFAIGDRDELTFNLDGSLDLYLQHTNPGPERVSNWLPAPVGPLGVTIRLYAPRPDALDGRWHPPAIRKTARSQP